MTSLPGLSTNAPSFCGPWGIAGVTRSVSRSALPSTPVGELGEPDAAVDRSAVRATYTTRRGQPGRERGFWRWNAGAILKSGAHPSVERPIQDVHHTG
jgi:hypothetical protein